MSVERATRLYAILARRSPTAVVLRRGPSKQVLLLRWDRSDDRFEAGQWLSARVYERRCDLSPGGRLLVYFAGKHQGEHPTYTAISKPPYFTALALFPKGDTWGGGGLFEGERHLRLNHVGSQMTLAPGFRLPRGFVLEPLHEHSGRGEDGPIEHLRRVRDGWSLHAEGQGKEHRLGSPLWLSLDPPQVYARPHPRSDRVVLQERRWGIHEVDGPWYVQDYAVVIDGEDHLVIERGDWADWDRNGDLLWAKGGRIHRAPLDAKRGRLGEARELVDLRDERFRRLEAPADARRW
ncbi:MAG: hypothetical protein H6712_27180 [Myxococcales bacterium]|nr:hypothetical protein [Myxococcales bacterium]MCB9717561.1 hypothetical protein [Myxococcales bacterium]